ncbi:MAG: hypothetical protein HZA92_18585 [Verrucomicrobia bacterium]|nr:hypothetical protein [Verrucomicrobiota bacterium]
MPTSGLIITLQPELATQAAAIARLRTRPELTLGELSQRWLPAALETRDDSDSREIHDWLTALPGVAFVDVVSVSFEAEAERSDGAVGCWSDEVTPVPPCPTLHHSTAPRLQPLSLP